jgi:hypothetical protein
VGTDAVGIRDPGEREFVVIDREIGLRLAPILHRVGEVERIDPDRAGRRVGTRQRRIDLTVERPREKSSHGEREAGDGRIEEACGHQGSGGASEERRSINLFK